MRPFYPFTLTLLPMKKIYTAWIALMLLCGPVVAQDVTELKSKRGEIILPEMDELGLGISANPFLDYFGNFFNASGNTPPSFDYAANPANRIAVFGKYMKDENTAYRIRLGLGVGTHVNKSVVLQNEARPDVNYPAFTEDWQKVNATNIVIAPGIEKRRGYSRVQGIYGGELVVGFTNSKTTYQYGNPFTSDFNAPITHDFGNNIASGTSTAAGSRVVENKDGLSILAGVRGFVGVEYFFAPKMSIGGEFGYMFGFQTQQRSLITTQTWDEQSATTRDTKTDNYLNEGLTSLGLGLDNLNGSINLLFYF